MPDNVDFEHDLRPGCAKEFGRLQEAQRNNHEFKEEMRHDLDEIRRAMSDIPEIKTMLVAHIGESTGGWQRIEALEQDIVRIEDKMWSERLKASGLTGSLLLLGSYLLERFNGG